MKSKAVALFLSLGLATTVAACSPDTQTEGEQTPPASTTQDEGEEGGTPTTPGSTNPQGEGEAGEDDQNDQAGEDGEEDQNDQAGEGGES